MPSSAAPPPIAPLRRNELLREHVKEPHDMPTQSQAARAYEAAASHRSMREQQADVFRHFNGALRAANGAGAIARARALADNRRLWGTVVGLMSDPANPLPAPLRASIISVGLAVQREMDRDDPDLNFLVSANENIAAGLAGEV
ncbi:MAG TPA: flagellar biosynthesis regulator FlaF [Acetobacteraceae bacterium]|nr:flagellar biosynthesis regulator FlaF [Acetobacteraceae bacterium]